MDGEGIHSMLAGRPDFKLYVGNCNIYHESHRVDFVSEDESGEVTLWKRNCPDDSSLSAIDVSGRELGEILTELEKFF